MSFSKIYFIVLLLATIQFIIIQSLSFPIAKNPIKLKLGAPYRKVNETTRFRLNPRSKPEFFLNVLNIKPGENRSIDSDSIKEVFQKIKLIENTGLFKNLTIIQSIKNSQYYIEIEGIELPSIEFAPEIAVKDFSDPDFSGGLLYRDRNFYGLGQQLNLLISKKEGTKEKTELPPSILLEWIDNSIGKLSKNMIKFERQHTIEKIKSIIPSIFNNKMNINDNNNILQMKPIHTILTEFYWTISK